MKIRGVTVGTTTPRPDWKQTNSQKANYIENMPDCLRNTSGIEGKFLCVIEGEWCAVDVEQAKTINGTPLKFFVGTKAAYDLLSNDLKNNLLAIITDDNTEEELRSAIGDVTSTLADYAKTSDLSGYAKTSDLSGYAPKYTYGIEDMEVGSSPLDTGTLYFVYK